MESILSQHWFLRRGNQERGPYSLHDLISLARKGKIRPTDQIRTPRSHGRSNWRPAADIKGLFGDPALLEEAKRLVGDEPAHPDNRADWWASVFELYEELLEENVEPVIESKFIDELADSTQRDALSGRVRHSAAALEPSGAKAPPKIDTSQQSVQTFSTSLEKCESADDLVLSSQKQADVISAGPTSGVAAQINEESANDELKDLFNRLDELIGYRDTSDPSTIEDSTGVPKAASPSAETLAEWNQARHFIFQAKAVDEQAKGVSLLLTLAEEGYVQPQALLGQLYRIGHIVPRDCQTAAHWLRKAADAGDGWSMQRLGVMLQDGDGIERNEAEACCWFQRGANLGINEAMNSLGICYLRGHGIAMDGEKAIHWLKAATSLDCEVAQYNLGRRYFLGEFVERDYEKALSHFKLASRWNDKEAPPSEWYIYWCYKDGCGTLPDLKTAVEWLQKGANRECPMSMAELGRMHMEGECVARDFSIGTQLLRKAAIAGDAHAQFFLGIAYQNGTGVPHDEGEAIRWFYLASKNRSKATDGFVLGNELAISHLWDMIAPLISDRLRFSLG